MKGALAAYVGALKAVARHVDLDDAPVSLVVTGHEEGGSVTAAGTTRRTAGHVTGGWALMVSPPGIDVSPATGASSGCASGSPRRSGHASSRTPARTAWAAARAVSPQLEALPMEVRDDRFDPSTPSLTVTSLQVEGEPSINTIPDAVWLSIDRSLLPGSPPTPRWPRSESAMRDTVAALLTWALTVNRVCPPYIAAPGDPLVDTVQRIVRQVGRAGTLGTDPAADDSSWLGNAGISTVSNT